MLWQLGRAAIFGCGAFSLTWDDMALPAAVWPANPACGPFSDTSAIPGGGFFLSSLSTSLLIGSSVCLCKGVHLLTCAHVGLSRADVPRWWSNIPGANRGNWLPSTEEVDSFPHRRLRKIAGLVSVYHSVSMLYQLLSDDCMSHWFSEPGRSPSHSVRAFPPSLPHWKLCAHSGSSDHPACSLPTQAPDAAAVCRPPVLPREGSPALLQQMGGIATGRFEEGQN